MDKRYDKIEKIIEQWFSFDLKLDVADIMPELIFLYEQNKELKEELQTVKQSEATHRRINLI